uniref:Uncharacterized protein n=1 Tax=Rhizophora mucronata TaxID=61149 RepID=A0A2P2PBN6_RHIMU
MLLLDDFICTKCIVSRLNQIHQPWQVMLKQPCVK